MKQVMNKAYLLIGGNMGDRKAMLATAQQEIGNACGEILQQSEVYETAAWGKTDQDAFLNQVLLVATPMDAETLLATVLDIELKMGRKREMKYGPRLMDIDILLFNNEVIDLPGLQVPHPHMQARRFVLEPLSALVPNLLHPVLGKTISQMLDQCTDPLEVYKL
jgi:2-amino-4-hydroxy-6-hydroxymethyldihydropteridine diphosphokinase